MTASRELEGRVAWVTGGATGMGRAAAMELAAMGASVCVASLSDAMRENFGTWRQLAFTLDDAALNEAARAIAAHDVGALALPLDVADPDSVGACHERIVAELGPVDILINAAGSSGRHPVSDHPDELWQAMLDVNLTGNYRTIKTCFPGMVERGWGRIVNIASTASLTGGALHAAYCAAKTGVLGLTRCVALEGAAHGVTCNAICPSWVKSEQNHRALIQEMEANGIENTTVEEFRVQMAEKWVPQKRFLEPAEPGAYAAFLCTEAARGITGEALRISGGSTW